MKINVLDHGSIELIESWGSDESIVAAARQSTQGTFRSWGTPEKPGDEKLLKFLWTHKHSSPFEFAGMVVQVEAPLLVFRELHRHRTWSYSEASARYSPLPDVNYLPTVERMGAKDEKNKQSGRVKGAPELTEDNACAFRLQLRDFYEQAEKLYQTGLALGVPKEVARVVLPVARYSRMRGQANLRNILAFLTLRQDPSAQYEIRVYADALAEMVQVTFPRTYELFAQGQ
jgi:thymidylate synthase (FAD)